jgi:isoleucyl-tRNA synthetase
MLQNLEKFSLPEIEEKVLKFWKTDQIFEKSLEKNAKKKEFVFFEGPPTANGRPGIHHILARIFKDIVLRYKTMSGFYVPRKGGWDTHGLPVELEVEKQLGLKTKKDIEKFGIAEFNRKCRESVWKYKDEWERMTERIGFWLDMKNPYVTYENSYIETLWWIIAEIAKKKLLYKGHKVVPWCSRCGTTLSSHEIALGYKEVEENSVYLKFKLKPGQKIGNYFKTDDKTFILSWTTTPWTLPGNVALAVGKDIDYSIVKNNDDFLIAATHLLVKIFPFQGETGLQGEGFIGRDLVGLEYEPLFDIKPLKTETAYKIYPAKFVTTTDGTGVVHTAVMYGEDDYNLGKEVGLPQFHTVDEQGNFTKDVPELGGLYVKDKATEKKVIDHLKKNNNLLREELYVHEYPFCWRCGTPLLYYARDSWFVGMSKLRGELLKGNEEINWIPESIKEGRFGEWLREVKDWAFSRERYWGTPLPVWQCDKCDELHVVGGVEELEKFQQKTGNRYVIIRHGQAVNNLIHRANSWPEKVKYDLTLLGHIQVEKLAKELQKKYKVDHIYASDFTRTKETEEIIGKLFEGEKVHFDARLREVDVGLFNTRPVNTYNEFYASMIEKFYKRPPEGESLTDIRTRVADFLKELEGKHEGKTIFIITHEYPAWMLEQVMRGWSDGEAVAEKDKRGEDFIRNAQALEVPFRQVPRDETGLMDLHRPYIDGIVFPCKKCDGEMKRVPEVADVWFDSGSMPFAQHHYPFGKKLDFPADYISEAMDQTRGWFYTLLAVATLLGKGVPFKNVISLGLILDKNGQKMSKSKGNVVDPWQMIEKYGVDTIRWYFFTVNPPGEPKKFDEADLGKTLRQFVLLAYNSFVFFNTYGERKSDVADYKPGRDNVLDRWITTRLDETIVSVTGSLDEYDIGSAAKKIEEFVGDLSRWYIRRSRRRFQKAEDRRDYENASQTLGYILSVLARLLAPFMPFFAEAMHKSLVHHEHASVHLEDWPKAKETAVDRKLIENMAEVRRLASVALAKRAEKGIKVRQPLNELTIKTDGLEKGLLDILKDEVNVKKVTVDRKLKSADGSELELDTNITGELREEGWLREFVRMIQDMRQDAKLQPKDAVTIFAELPAELREVVKKYEATLKKEVNAVEIDYKRADKFDVEIDSKLDEWKVWVALRK